MIAHSETNSWSVLLSSHAARITSLVWLIEKSAQCEQSGTESRAIACHREIVGDRLNQLNPAKVHSMEQYRPSFRRRLVSAWGSFRTWLALLRPRTPEVRSNRMCPFCGLITPRAKRVCLECGKSLSAVSLERAEAKQG